MQTVAADTHAALWFLEDDDRLSMPDRVIAATALFHGVPLVTRDAKIRSCGIATIW
jgi:PIN domain nuclease of toxin-antitoxin system